MSFTADSNGVVHGNFNIPANIPAGNKSVVIVGGFGGMGSAIFSGQGTLERMQWQQQTTIIDLDWSSPPPPLTDNELAALRVDPLAQTFTMLTSVQLSAIDLYFSVAPTTKAKVQIRETTAGFPNQTIVAEADIAIGSVNIGGTATTITLAAPVLLTGGVEYALVVLCNDSTGAMYFAELGKFDSAHSAWVTVQPYTVGTMLSSSNASTWTAYQDRDLTFQLKTASYTETSHNLSLGTVSVTAATDLLLMTYADRPASGTRVDYTLTLPDASVVKISDGEPLHLPAAITGTVAVNATVVGTADFSAVQRPGTQIAAGVMSTTADYVTRAIPAGTAVTLKVIFEALVPSGANVQVYRKGPDGGDTWVELTSPTTRAVDDGFVEFSYSQTPITELTLQVKIVLTGTPAARPRVRELRAIVLS